MSHGSQWTREQLLVAFNLYCQMPFGKLHSRNPEIIRYAAFLGRSPSALAMKLTNIASLDPAITSTGRKGLKGASGADRAMWEEMRSDWQAFASASSQAIGDLLRAGESAESLDSVPDDELDYTGGDRAAEVKVRIGQGFFRRAVLSAYEYRCCMTGLAVPGLLVASHIIPWRQDAVNRLNPRNGLALSVLHDKAFDTGIITINQDMTVRVSKKKFIKEDSFYMSALLRYHGKRIELPDKFHPDPEFLAFHRDQVFEHWEEYNLEQAGEDRR